LVINAIQQSREEGFREYFDPITGAGYGSVLFSWTAALLIDVLIDKGTRSANSSRRFRWWKLSTLIVGPRRLFRPESA
jgi:hypothetical protein